MTKIIQPLSDSDDIKRAADESTKEQYADYYINQPMPDPLDFHSDRNQLTHPQPEPPEPTVEDLAHQNDPLKDL